MSILIGIDLGITRAAPTALAVYDEYRDRVLETREIKPDNAGAADARIGEIALALSEQLRALHPQALAYEMSHIAINPQAGLKLAMLAGAIVLIAYEMGLPVYKIQPAQAKQALAGYHAADKEAMIKAAEMQYQLRDLSSHCADAVGIALAGSAIYKRDMLEARIS